MDRDFVRLTEVILSAVAAKRIYVLAKTDLTTTLTSAFRKDAIKIQTGLHLHLLVLVELPVDSTASLLQDKIEQITRDICSTTVIVVEINQFSNWISEGHPFALVSVTNADLIFEAPGTPASQNTAIACSELADSKQSIAGNGLNKVHEFLAGSDLFVLRKQNQLAAFMLHQSTEHALLTILKIHTGLRVTTHNLTRLIQLCLMGDLSVSNVYNKDSQEDQRVLKLLQRAYIDARYRQDYQISLKDLSAIRAKVHELAALIS